MFPVQFHGKVDWNSFSNCMSQKVTKMQETELVTTTWLIAKRIDFSFFASPYLGVNSCAVIKTAAEHFYDIEKKLPLQI